MQGYDPARVRIPDIKLVYFFILEDVMGGEGAQRPVLRVHKIDKRGARSARACTRGQNPLVFTKKMMTCTLLLGNLLSGFCQPQSVSHRGLQRDVVYLC